MKFIVVDAKQKPGILMLAKYQGKRLIGRAELELGDFDARAIREEIEMWRKAA